MTLRHEVQSANRGVSLVAFMVWMADPNAQFREQLGIAVLLFLGVFFVVAYAMKRAFWKDIH